MREMVCKFCNQEMELDCTENIGEMDQVNIYICVCGSQCDVYEADREPDWHEGGKINTCKFCGCTDNRACLGGCYWLDKKKTICSKCLPALLEDYRSKSQGSALSDVEKSLIIAALYDCSIGLGKPVKVEMLALRDKIIKAGNLFLEVEK